MEELQTATLPPATMSRALLFVLGLFSEKNEYEKIQTVLEVVVSPLPVTEQYEHIFFRIKVLIFNILHLILIVTVQLCQFSIVSCLGDSCGCLWYRCHHSAAAFVSLQSIKSSVHTESTNESSHTNHVVNQNETRQDEPQDVTYSLIELKNIKKNGKKQKAEESCVYSKINTGAEDNVTYAKINRLNVGKGKSNEDRDVILERPASSLFKGEPVTLRCRHQAQTQQKNASFYEDGSLIKTEARQKLSEEVAIQPKANSLYTCRFDEEEESEPIKIRVKTGPIPVLHVSPLWLSSVDSVTLSCEVQHASAGWRFYWYKAVPKLTATYYTYELLPGSGNGTVQDVYVAHGQTGRYACRAGRGNPVYYTYYSAPEFVWSADFLTGAASISVSPSKVQHFTSDSVSLSCEGNATKWRVMRFSASSYLTRCTTWGTMTGSTCNIHRSQHIDGVYWCESDAGEFSNAVNITGEYHGLIMESPVHPTAEGASVTLSCKSSMGDTLSKVDFYKNGNLIQNDSGAVLTLTEVSKSDEGFYQCKGKDSTQRRQSWASPESWVSVKTGITPHRSLFPVLLAAGLVCVVLFIVFLLLFLYLHTRSKDFCCKSSPVSATDHISNQDESPTKEHAPLFHAVGDFHLYESVNDPVKTENGESSDVTYTSIELKSLAKKETKPQPTLSADSTIRPPGGAVTLTCSVQDSDGWRYELYREISSSTYKYYKDFTGPSVQVSVGGVYYCRGVRGNPVIYTVMSNKFTVLQPAPVLTFEPSWSQMFRGETVTFHCQVQEGGDTGWTYEWTINNNRWRTNSVNRVSDKVYQSGEYRCRRKSVSSSTVWSDPITLTVSETKPQPTLSADSSIRPPGGAVTLTCSVQDSDGWRYVLHREGSSSPYKGSKDFTGHSVQVSVGGVYSCLGERGNPVIYTGMSNKFTVLERAPVLTFEPSWSQIFTGERVEFTCSIQGSGVSRWTYEWRPATLNPAPVSSSQSRTITATEPDSGDYSCRGRKDPNLATEWSNIITLTVSRHRPKAQLSAESRDLPVGGSVTLTCSVEPPSSGWRFFWFRGDKNSELLKTPVSDGPISVSEEGVYWCRGGRGRGDGSYVYYTEYSEGIRMNKPKPVLTVSPSWLSPGDSLTLTCEVQRLPAGWSFFWFKAVPKLSDDLYSYEPISDSSSGTEQDFYTVHGQSHTAGYMCRAGRGTPVYSTDDSEVKFVWSGEVQSSASLTVSPPTVQHFTSDPVSVKCEGNSTRWRVMRFNPVNERLTSCSSWGRMTGPGCKMETYSNTDASVYWCESGSGEFSNAVNITTHSSNITLRSPVHPVTEGHPVSLSCRLQRNHQFVSNVIFYQNDKVVQNDTSREFNISAVSRSHEGFYKCRHLNEESAQSWMSVKGHSASFPVWVIVVVVCGIVVIILLLLLYRCRASNLHTESTNKSSHTNHVVNQNETRQDEPQNVTYSLIELKNIKKNGKKQKAEESCVYSKINTGAEDNVTYAKINRLNVGKGKSKEGKEPAAADEAVYSQITLGAFDFELTFQPNWSTLFTGESVTLVCDIKIGVDTDWYYAILKNGQSFISFSTNKRHTLQLLTKDHSGEYQCLIHHRGTGYFSLESSKVFLTVSDRDVILERPASSLFKGEPVTLRCRHRTQTQQKNASFYEDGSLIKTEARQKLSEEVAIQPKANSFYTCRFDEEDESEPIKIRVKTYKPVASLNKDNKAHNVTLTCSVAPSSSGWKFFWYRGRKTSAPLTARDAVFLSKKKISISQEGIYWCRGGRGNPRYYTEYSQSIVTYRPVVRRQPTWPKIYYTESITLLCEIEDEGDFEWEYEWAIPSMQTPERGKEYVIKYSGSSHRGDYRCMGRVKSERSATEWSDAFTLVLSESGPIPVLHVSPLWLSSGDSVTLSCEVQHASAGWRFYWYKAVPKLTATYYTYELLPGSRNGTVQDFYVAHGQTGRYACRAGRGNPVYYTYYSAPEFVWSADFLTGTASISVSPSKVQHFTSDSVSLSCEGNATKWRVMRFSASSYLTRCTTWGTMTGSTCNIHRSQHIDGVYWCESDAGEFSNAVNITGQHHGMIMESPVHPIAEGASVTLSCKSSMGDTLSKVDFYKNGKLIQNDSGAALTLTEVSKSDEGFYQCKGKDSTQRRQSWASPESWVSVKSGITPHRSLFPVLLAAGLVCVVLFIVFLLLFLYLHTRSKDFCCKSSPVSATDHISNQDKRPTKEHAPLFHAVGDSHLYESVNDPVNTENGESSDVTYTSIELKNLAKKETKLQPTLSADSSIRPPGGAVTLTCSVQDSDGWRYLLYREGSSHPYKYSEDFTGHSVQVSVGGVYYCRGVRGDPVISTEESNKVTVLEPAVLTFEPSWSQIFRGETVTFHCQFQEGGDTRWTYEWTINNNRWRTNSVNRVSDRVDQSGEYRCRRKSVSSSTEWSDPITLTVSESKPRPTLSADSSIRPPGGTVTLTCSVQDSDGWRYVLYREGSSSPYYYKDFTGPSVQVSVGGVYYCRGVRGNPVIYTEQSNKFTVLEPAPVLTFEPSWSQIFTGERVEFTCSIQGSGVSRWTYEWRPATLNSAPVYSSQSRTITATESDSGDYSCRGRKDPDLLTEWSNIITLTVSRHRPKAELSAESRVLPVGGSVTLTCSVEPPSSGWRFFWSRGDKNSELLKTPVSDGPISVSEGGVYWCRGGRGRGRASYVYYTEYSEGIRINGILANRAVVTLQPNWSEIFSGESITLTCEIQDEEDSEWKIEWKHNNSRKYSSTNELIIESARESHSGDYRCKGRKSSVKSTEWSDPVKITVSNKPKPVLTVSPSWLSPGDSLTLTCEVQRPPAGWSFFWFKAVPKLSDDLYQSTSYSYEPISDSSSGTEQDFYTVHGQSHTAGYMCRAGRGTPVYSTHDSEVKFVWSGEVQSSASLTVSPPTVQHFTSDPVSVKCEGNSTRWRVMRFDPVNERLTSCSSWGRMTGRECNMNTGQHSDASVYWCESGSGEFSNAVNITTHKTNIILRSPVHPVTEGDPVSLSCRLQRNHQFVSNVIFYQNDKVVQNDTSREFNISAVFRSHEGFYKCRHLNEESAQSWMSVKEVSTSESSASFPVWVIVGIVCGILLIVLLLLCHCRPSKDSRSSRLVPFSLTHLKHNEEFTVFNVQVMDLIPAVDRSRLRPPTRVLPQIRTKKEITLLSSMVTLQSMKRSKLATDKMIITRMPTTLQLSFKPCEKREGAWTRVYLSVL
ncbi:uncharacterized protein V6R79_011171 [Siganus canaliculatus]